MNCWEVFQRNKLVGCIGIEMDKGKQIVTGRTDAAGNGTSNKKIRGLVDRSKLRILLCDTDANNCREVATLLRKCSYQVISVGSTREAIYVLNCEGASIDIVLAEADYPMANCLKMLKYITQDQELRGIPVIMLVAQDHISMIAKCLIHGAVDYLITPLGSNELLNLWTHVWRTRRMLGLPEKNMFHSELERFVASAIIPANAYKKKVILSGEASASQK